MAAENYQFELATAQAQQSLLLQQLASLKQFLEFHGLCSNFDCNGDCNLVHFVPDDDFLATEYSGSEEEESCAEEEESGAEEEESCAEEEMVEEEILICDDANCDICMG